MGEIDGAAFYAITCDGHRRIEVFGILIGAFAIRPKGSFWTVDHVVTGFNATNGVLFPDEDTAALFAWSLNAGADWDNVPMTNGRLPARYNRAYRTAMREVS